MMLWARKFFQLKDNFSNNFEFPVTISDMWILETTSYTKSDKHGTKEKRITRSGTQATTVF